MTEMFDDICFRFVLENEDDGVALETKWGVMQTPYCWEISVDSVVDRYSYRRIAADLDLILKALRSEPGLNGLHFQVIQGSTIRFVPSRGQQMLFKIKFCGEELMDD